LPVKNRIKERTTSSVMTFIKWAALCVTMTKTKSYINEN